MKELPIPAHFDPQKVGEVWEPAYNSLYPEARKWAETHGIEAAVKDRMDPNRKTVAFMGIDIQNTFCIPGYELYVGGRSGTGAIDDTRRTCEWIYRNLANLTKITLTLDTHYPIMIFHEIFWVNNSGEHPAPSTMISVDDVRSGVWKVNPQMAGALGVGYPTLQTYAIHYTESLEKKGRYCLLIWPYHGMLTSIGHASVASIAEASFWHNICRSAQIDIQIKGNIPWSENYSIFGAEVMSGPDNKSFTQKNTALLENLMSHDYVVIAGQAKSHCVAWTISDLLNDIMVKDPALVKKVYLLEDCTSAVVIPGILDFTDQADQAFADFQNAGMHVVNSTIPMANWPNVEI